MDPVVSEEAPATLARDDVRERRPHELVLPYLHKSTGELVACDDKRPLS